MLGSQIYKNTIYTYDNIHTMGTLLTSFIIVTIYIVIGYAIITKARFDACCTQPPGMHYYCAGCKLFPFIGEDICEYLQGS
jgi:hypothetical protein